MPVVYTAVKRFDPGCGKAWPKFVAWSGLTALTAAMPTYGSLLAIRPALGFGQAVTEPSAATSPVCCSVSYDEGCRWLVRRRNG